VTIIKNAISAITTSLTAASYEGNPFALAEGAALLFKLTSTAPNNNLKEIILIDQNGNIKNLFPF
jgi:hypothetical protein